MSHLSVLRFKWRITKSATISRSKTEIKEIEQDIDDIDKKVVKMGKTVKNTQLQTAAGMLDMLSMANATRFAFADLKEFADGEGGLDDLISLMTTLIIMYFQLLRLQEIAKLNQATLLFGLTGGQAAGLAVALGIGAFAMNPGKSKSGTGGTRGTSVMTDTMKARLLGVQP